MPRPPPDDDLDEEWRKAPPTEVELLPADLVELQPEEPTPVREMTELVLTERERRDVRKDERERVIRVVGALLSKSRNVTPRQVADFIDLIRLKLDHPGNSK